MEVAALPIAVDNHKDDVIVVKFDDESNYSQSTEAGLLDKMDSNGSMTSKEVIYHFYQSCN